MMTGSDIDSERSVTSPWRTAGTSGRTGRSRRRTVAEARGIPVFWHLALAESIEFIAHADHEITRQRIIQSIVYIIGGHRTLHIRTLAKDIEGLEADSRRTVAQEIGRAHV